ncbi:F0F1 ATP synthase subunit B [Blattabacterium cuenoti]|uniref:F0F1 ATP synthase subunit B n=1 Tax=Blattabacterium cuenoti TaxID=1653831 RepID=UPI00163B9F4C|nr:F0F1 ATP synthase subunit B [Blattabacterium cuenoti]
MDLISPSIGLIFWNTIIFLMLILFLSKFAWNPIIKFIEKRENKIKDSIKKAHKIEIELKNVKIKKNKILEEARKKKELILEKALIIGEEIRSKAKKDGILQQKKILDNTKKMIDFEQKKSIQLFKNQIKNISIDIAEKILKKELHNNFEQENFIKDLITKE